MKLSSSIIFSSRRKFLTFSILAGSKAVCSRSCIVAVSFIAPPVTTYTPFAGLMAYILNQDDRPTRFFSRAFSFAQQTLRDTAVAQWSEYQIQICLRGYVHHDCFKFFAVVNCAAYGIIDICDLEITLQVLGIGFEKLRSQATSFHWSNREYRMLSSSPSYLTAQSRPSSVISSKVISFIFLQRYKIFRLYTTYRLYLFYRGIIFLC